MKLVRAGQDVDAFSLVPGPALRCGETFRGRPRVVQSDEAVFGEKVGVVPGDILDGTVGAVVVGVLNNLGG